MDPNVTTAIVRACATALVAILAIVNYNRRLDDANLRLARVESKLDTIEQMLAPYAVNMGRIKEKLGIA